MSDAPARITYTNYKGETAERHIRPTGRRMFFGAPEWHPQPQWLLEAYDLDKQAERVFAMSGVKAWRTAE